MFLQKTFQQNAQGLTGSSAPQWYIIDAKDMVLGRLATVIARVITGKHKTTYTRHVDTGDFVVVINSDKVKLTGNKWLGKIYYRHTGWHGGLKERTALDLMKHKPEEMIRKAVWGMTNKSTLARAQVKKLKVYASDKHPHEAQQPQVLPANVTRKTILAGA